MVAMTILKPFQFYVMTAVSLVKMSGSRVPVNLEFCHHDATAVFLIPVVLSLGFALTLIDNFSYIGESMLIKYPRGLFWMWSQIGPELLTDTRARVLRDIKSFCRLYTRS